MKETGLTGKRRSTTIAATPDDGNSQRKRRRSDFLKLVMYMLGYVPYITTGFTDFRKPVIIQ